MGQARTTGERHRATQSHTEPFWAFPGYRETVSVQREQKDY